MTYIFVEEKAVIKSKFTHKNFEGESDNEKQEVWRGKRSSPTSPRLRYYKL